MEHPNGLYVGIASYLFTVVPTPGTVCYASIIVVSAFEQCYLLLKASDASATEDVFAYSAPFSVEKSSQVKVYCVKRDHRVWTFVESFVGFVP